MIFQWTPENGTKNQNYDLTKEIPALQRSVSKYTIKLHDIELIEKN